MLLNVLAIDSVPAALAAIVLLGAGAQWLAWKLHLPSILLLLLTGFLAGPLTGFLDPSTLFDDGLHPIISLAVGVILFEGGLSLEISELRKIGPLVVRLCTLGVLLTWIMATALAHYLVEMPWPLATLFGAILTVTGPTVIGPLLRHVRPQGSVGDVAKWEGIVADVIGATLAVLTFHAIAEVDAEESSTLMVTLGGLLKTGLVGTVAGILGAFALGLPLRRFWVPDSLHIPMTMGILLVVFVASDSIQHESGLLAVTLMGFLMANQKATSIHHIIEFKENLRTLLIASLFVVLAAGLKLESLLGLGWREFAFAALLILLIRPVSVLLSMWGSDCKPKERAFLAWLAPRGVVAAAISALFAAQLSDPEQMGSNVMPEAAELVPLSFLVIVSTVAVYGLSAAPLARRLGLASANPQGCLIVGAGNFAQLLAKALVDAELKVVVMDTNRHSIKKARMAGIPAIPGSAIAADAEERLPLGGIGRILALTPNDEVNALAAVHFRELFGRAEVYQLMPSGINAKEETSSNLRGRYLFSEEVSFAELERRASSGARVVNTQLTEAFGFEDYLAQNGDSVVPLFRLSAEGRLQVMVAGETPKVEAGDRIISLVDADPAEE